MPLFGQETGFRARMNEIKSLRPQRSTQVRPTAETRRERARRVGQSPVRGRSHCAAAAARAWDGDWLACGLVRFKSMRARLRTTACVRTSACMRAFVESALNQLYARRRACGDGQTKILEGRTNLSERVLEALFNVL